MNEHTTLPGPTPAARTPAPTRPATLGESHSNWLEQVVKHSAELPEATVRAHLHDAPPAYIAECAPALVADDLTELATLARGQRSATFIAPPDEGSPAHIRIRCAAAPAPLHTLLPVLDNLGLLALDERSYQLHDPQSDLRIYDITVHVPSLDRPGPDLPARIEDTIRAVWRGETTNDGLHRLVTGAGLTIDQVRVVRAYAGYLQQAGLPYTPQHVEAVLVDHGTVTAELVRLFEARFAPSAATHTAATADATARAAVDAVHGIDADRILRSILTAIRATTRTTAFTGPRHVLGLKLAAQRIDYLPRPRPRHEILVHGVDVHGCHLRFDDIARGGIRWSDRPDDYRTEILGLVTAQAVKNAVIVPAGAKGGFVVTASRPGAEHVRYCYRQFVSTLLDLTDDIDPGTGQVIPARTGRRHDDDDTYLVIAADKGTATMSDLANTIAVERGYWLGDAFASGGSSGYDHKAMGITARGAWESARRHLREMGIDPEAGPFRVIGIGDMSGDVFGNGMLSSTGIQLVAAFDHRHIFIDPEPDTATSYTERRRLFGLDRSCWDDYDRTALSPGGAVVERGTKAVPITPPMRAALGLPDDVDVLSADELARAVLRAPADLLWNGGIGTFVKATTQSHRDCGDKANDTIRVDAADLRVRAVVEGGNLGLTQAGRIEYARAGGRINTDALDNSAGVHCSDLEVNIKIALAALCTDGNPGPDARHHLLSNMAGDVADAVLTQSRRQNNLLGTCRREAERMIGVHARIVDRLEREGVIDRTVDHLPATDTFRELVAHDRGLSSPELAQLAAQIKNDLRHTLLASTVPDEPSGRSRLHRYFPPTLAARTRAVDTHPLGREIVTSMLVNDLVDTAGISFIDRLREDTAAEAADCVRAFDVATRVFDLDTIFAEINALPGPTDAIDALTEQVRRLLDRATRWLIQNRPLPLDVEAEARRYQELTTGHMADVRSRLQDEELAAVRRRTATLVAAGAPEGLGGRVADLLHAFCFLDIIEIAHHTSRPFTAVAATYFTTSARLGVNTYLTAVSELGRRDRWQGLARLSLREELYRALTSIVTTIVSTTEASAPALSRIEQWERARATRLRSTRTLLATAFDDHQQSDTPRLDTLSVVVRQLRTLSR